MSLTSITKMTNQYKTQSHRKEVLIALRWQAAILGGSILYFILEYLFGYVIQIAIIRVIFFTGFASLLVILTYLLVRRFNKYLPLSEHLILSYNLSFKILFIAVTLLIFFVVISNIDINLVSGYSKLKGYIKYLSSDSFSFPIRSMLAFVILFEGYLRVLPLLAVKRFNFYHAKTLVGFSLYGQKEDEVKRIKHLLVGIDSYRKYLRYRLNLDIDSAKLYPKITALDSKDRNALIKSMYEAFSEDADKLKPIVCLTTSLNLPPEEIVVKEHTRDKIKQLSLLFIPIITVMISLFNLFNLFD
jgi:hypothetical protein